MINKKVFTVSLFRSFLGSTGLSLLGISIFKNLHAHFSLTKDTKYIELASPIAHVHIDASSEKLYMRDLSLEAKKCVSEFIDELGQKNHIDLSNFYLNAHPGFIVKKKSFPILDKYSGFYFAATSQIFYKINLRSVIFHELLHMASHSPSPSYWLCGFHQIKKSFENEDKKYCDLGAGLDEGYTELLALRYFSKYGDVLAYKLFVNLAFYIEVIVGRRCMEELYFKSNLTKLVEILCSYASREDVITLLNDIDYLLGAMYKCSTTLTTTVAHMKYQRILIILTKIVLKKKDMDEMDTKTTKALLYSIKSHMVRSKKGTFKAGTKTKAKLLELTTQSRGISSSKAVNCKSKCTPPNKQLKWKSYDTLKIDIKKGHEILKKM